MINMIKPLLATTFLFSFLFIFPAFAYLPININASVNVACTNPQGFHCLNTSACYLFCGNAGTGSYDKVVLYNATLWPNASCENHAGGTAGTGSFMTNRSIVRWNYYTGAYEYNITELWNLTSTCPYLRTITYSSDTATKVGSWYSVDNTYYVSGIWWSDSYQAGIHNDNSTYGKLENPFWSAATHYSVMLPNISDNSTLYINEGGYNFKKYINRALVAEYSGLNETWGISISTASSMVKENASTTWLYVVSRTGSAPYRLYKVNFSLLENGTLNASTIDGIYPIANLTISQAMNPTVQLDAFLDTNDNGTIMWYVDNVFAGNQSITGPYYNDVYYSTQILAAGQHNWTAIFVDSYGNKWYTNDSVPVNEDFFMQPTSAITTVGQSLANALGVSLDYGKMMLALLISAALSGALAYYVKWQLFLPSMVVCIFFFAVAGFFPAWFTLVFIVIGGVLFAKFSGLV